MSSPTSAHPSRRSPSALDPPRPAESPDGEGGAVLLGLIFSVEVFRDDDGEAAP